MRKTPDQRILRFVALLREAGSSSYVSGQSLAKQSGISRSAVWKQVLNLRRYGYDIASIRGKGYKLVKDTQMPVPWELKRRLRTSLVGKEIIYVRTVDSTQRVALSLADANPESSGAVVIAEQQKSGRGRLKRKWVSPAGGLWFSVILRPNIPTSSITLLPLAAALAVGDAILANSGVKTHLKWPNDVMISGNKVAGILLDVSAEADLVNYAVIGVGINANLDASELATRIGADQQITSLSDELGREVNRLDLIHLVLENLERNLDVLVKTGGALIINRWKESSDMIGRRVTISQDGRNVRDGTVVDLNEDGSLVLVTKSGTKVSIASGDIRVRY